VSDELLALAAEAARLAGGLLLERAERGAERDVASKSSPTDLVSEADLAAQRAIRELLSARRPKDGFLGEEGGDEAGASGLRWIVDPLDGTVNYLLGIPQWSVSVAVADEAGTLAGAVYDPNRKELFTAGRTGDAVLETATSTRELRGRDAGPGGPGAELATAMIATGLAYDAGVREAQARVLARLAGRVRDIRRFGSAALDLAWTAAGRFDAYYERSVKPWDIAAGELACRRAGLEVRELPEQDALPWGILVAPGHLVEELERLVTG
jgi:myo-inositol-1(or 4)-monophosphatase